MWVNVRLLQMGSDIWNKEEWLLIKVLTLIEYFKTQPKYTMYSMEDRVKEFMGKGVSDSEKNQYGLTTSHLHQHIKDLEP